MFRQKCERARTRNYDAATMASSCQHLSIRVGGSLMKWQVIHCHERYGTVVGPTCYWSPLYVRTVPARLCWFVVSIKWWCKFQKNRQRPEFHDDFDHCCQRNLKKNLQIGESFFVVILLEWKKKKKIVRVTACPKRPGMPRIYRNNMWSPIDRFEIFFKTLVDGFWTYLSVKVFPFRNFLRHSHRQNAKKLFFCLQCLQWKIIC